jgi:hypothetical protein
MRVLLSGGHFAYEMLVGKGCPACPLWGHNPGCFGRNICGALSESLFEGSKVHLVKVDEGIQYVEKRILFDYKGYLWHTFRRGPRTAFCSGLECNKSSVCYDLCEGKDERALCVVLGREIYGSRSLCGFGRVDA